MIPDRLVDKTTAFEKQGKKHTTYTHLGCILLRIFLGLLVYYKFIFFKNLFFLIPFFLLIVIFFSYKVIETKNKTWKVYLRTILFYSLASIISIIDKNLSRNNAGLLMIIDSLMGLQSRHIQNNFKE